MAIAWEVKVVVTDEANRQLSITGVRTDDAIPAAPVVRTYTVGAKYDPALTKAQNATAWTNRLWDTYQADLATEARIATFIGTAEAFIASALLAKEGA